MAARDHDDDEYDEYADERVDDRRSGTVGRLVGAVELVAVAHAKRAKEEVGRDLGRLVVGAVLLVGALALLLPIVVLLDIAVSLYLAQRAAMSLPAALAWVAAGNGVMACILGLLARSRLAHPVLVETRATLKRAAIVLRG